MFNEKLWYYFITTTCTIFFTAEIGLIFTAGISLKETYDSYAATTQVIEELNETDDNLEN